MKRILIFLMVASILLSLAACGSTVDVTLPASFSNGMTEEEIQKTVEENGYISGVVNEDGSITYTMTKVKQKELLNEYATSIEETITDYLVGDGKVASFLSVDHNKDFSKIDIYVDDEAYTTWDNLYALTFYLLGASYQSMAGVDAETIDVVVNFIDNDNKEILHTSSYKEYITSNNRSDE